MDGKFQNLSLSAQYNQPSSLPKNLFVSNKWNFKEDDEQRYELERKEAKFIQSEEWDRTITHLTKVYWDVNEPLEEGQGKQWWIKLCRYHVKKQAHAWWRLL